MRGIRWSPMILVSICFLGSLTAVSSTYQPEERHPSCTMSTAGLTSCHFDKENYCGVMYRNYEFVETWKLAKEVYSGNGYSIQHDWQPKPGKRGYFAYMDVNNPRLPIGAKARLTLPIVSIHIKAVCIQLHYATTSGNGVPTITIYNDLRDGTTKQIGKIKDDSKGKWKVAEFHSCVWEMSKIVFESEKLGEDSFVALDYILVTNSTMDCPDEMYIPPTTTNLEAHNTITNSTLTATTDTDTTTNTTTEAPSTATEATVTLDQTTNYTTTENTTIISSPMTQDTAADSNMTTATTEDATTHVATTSLEAITEGSTNTTQEDNTTAVEPITTSHHTNASTAEETTTAPTITDTTTTTQNATDNVTTPTTPDNQPTATSSQPTKSQGGNAGSQSDDDDDGGLSDGTKIALIAVGAVVGLILVVAAVLAIIRQRMKTHIGDGNLYPADDKVTVENRKSGYGGGYQMKKVSEIAY